MPSNGPSVTRTIAGLDIAHRIEQKIPGAVEGAIPEAATVKADKLAEVCTFLRDDPELKLDVVLPHSGVSRTHAVLRVLSTADTRWA